MSTNCTPVARLRGDGGYLRKKIASSVILGLSFAAAPMAHSTTFTVANTNNAGSGSLRDAVGQANVDAVPPSIVLIPSNITGTITLSTGQIEITNAMSVQGPGASKLTVSGNNSARQFYVHPGAGAGVTISGLKLAHGYSAGVGGAIYSNTANLTVSNCDFENNSAGGSGGAMYVYASNANVTISGIMARGNSAGSGGAIAVNVLNGTASIQSSAISGNTATTDGGGGLYLLGGSVTVASTQIFDNHAPGRTGGGVAALNGDLTINDSTVSGNSAGADGGGMYLFDASITMNRTLLDNNSALGSGGGLALSHAYYTTGVASATIQNSTISNNHSTGGNGGGIAVFDDANAAATLSNITLFGNTAAGTGGGVYSSVGKPHTGPIGTAILTIESSTSVGNHAATGGGIAAATIGNHVTLHDSIVANNIATTADPDLVGNFDAKYNFIKEATGAVLTGGNNTSGVDPALGTLAVNGGPTPTLLPVAGSPVIDAGDPGFVSTHDSTDQRGLPRLLGARIDIGAVERQSPEDVIFRNGFDLP